MRSSKDIPDEFAVAEPPYGGTPTPVTRRQLQRAGVPTWAADGKTAASRLRGREFVGAWISYSFPTADAQTTRRLRHELFPPHEGDGAPRNAGALYEAQAVRLYRACGLTNAELFDFVEELGWYRGWKQPGDDGDRERAHRKRWAAAERLLQQLERDTVDRGGAPPPRLVSPLNLWQLRSVAAARRAAPPVRHGAALREAAIDGAISRLAAYAVPKSLAYLVRESEVAQTIAIEAEVARRQARAARLRELVTVQSAGVSGGIEAQIAAIAPSV
jgi:hypothetical protein